MGNCLADNQQRIVRIIKVDGKVLEYKAPIEVQQVLSDFPDHYEISENLTTDRVLRPETKLVGRGTYFLRPASLPAVETAKGRTVVRVKVVISKQELKELLLRKGGVSVCEMVSQLQSKQRLNRVDMSGGDDDSETYKCKGWKPALESIAEVN